MLTLTETARRVVRKIPKQPYLNGDAGLRISRRDGDADAPLVVAAEPEPFTGDEVLQRGGARVFLGKHAAAELDGLVLDAATAEDGRIQFTVAPQV